MTKQKGLSLAPGGDVKAVSRVAGPRFDQRSPNAGTSVTRSGADAAPPGAAPG